MARLVRFWAADLETAPLTTVYTRASWEDSSPWVVVPNCYCVSASKTNGRAISSAQLIFEYGIIQQAGSETFAAVLPLDINGQWIKVEWTPNSGQNNFDFQVADATERTSYASLEAGQRVRQADDGVIYDWDGAIWTASGDSSTAGLETWYGIATDDEKQVESDVGAVASGTQLITCHGPEWLLTREQITTTVIEDVAGVSTRTVLTGVPFNEHRGDVDNQQQGAGNQSNVPDVNGVQIFAKDLSNPRKWNAKDIIEHLLAYHAPLNYAATPPAGAMAFTLDAANDNLLTWWEPINLITHGRTVWDVLNAAVPASRGIYWYLQVDETTDEFIVKVESALPTGITLPVSGTAVAANGDQVDWNYEGEAGIRTSSHRDSLQKQYSKITVEGARRGCVCTLGVSTGELVTDWDDTGGNDDVLAYEEAASNKGFYAGLEGSDKNFANDGMRMHDEVLSRVFTHFRIGQGWSGKAGDGITTATSAVNFVLRAHDRLAQDLTVSGGGLVNEDGDTIVLEDGSTPVQLEQDVSGFVLSSSWWIDGIRIEPYLPLYKAYDYTDATAPVDNLPSGSVPEFRRPFTTCAMVDSATDVLDVNNREYVDHLGSAAFRETATRGAGLDFNGRMRPMRNAPGIIIDASVPGHVFGRGIYDVLTASPSSYVPHLDYRTHASTVYLTFPEHVRVTVPATPVVSHNHESELVIRLGERAHCDLLLQSTIVGLSGGEVQKVTSASAYIRDDRELLRNVAGMAWEWYQTPRQATTLSIDSVSSQAKLGELVVNDSIIGDVNAVVSEISWDFRSGSTRVRTDFVELDFGGLV